MQAGAPIEWIISNNDPHSSISPDYTIVPGIVFALADDYGWDVLEDFVRLLLSPNERISGFDSGNLGELFRDPGMKFEMSSTAIAAAWTIVTEVDQFDRFTEVWHFPLDVHTYDEVLQVLTIVDATTQ